MRMLLPVILIALVPAAHGATVGAMPPSGSSTISGGPPFMLIGLSHPARENASLTTATVRWISAPAAGCAAAFRVKFLRPALANTTYNVIAERGPFNAVNGINVVPLSPAVSVQPRDVIGVTLLKPLAGCGAVAFSFADGEGVRSTSSITDPSSGPISDTGLDNTYIMNARASTSADVVEGYLAAVGSVQGGFGSNFKTTVQLTNADFQTINGKLVFHPAGSAASPVDPTLSFSIPPGATISYDDVVAAMGRSGLGSMDIVTTNGYPPIASARVFNDQGPAGTSGLTLDMATYFDALRTNHFGELTAPANLTDFRLNIGVRSLDAGATVTIFARDANGNDLGAFFTRSYPPNFFEQRSAADFLNIPSLPANAVVMVQVVEGAALLYGATTDNRTNDPNVKFFTRY